jgi:hypothetical protein
MAAQTAADIAGLFQVLSIEAPDLDLDWYVMGVGEEGLQLMVRRKAYGTAAKERERGQEWRAMQAGEDAWWLERGVQAQLLRCVIANPFRPIPVVSPAWLTWHDGCVARMAQLIYDERRFDELPILADALEEAGCDNADILNHCRRPGEHVRGCWVVDLLLNKS